jgi:hypothetical protein
MLPTPFEKITETDLQDLIANAVAECRTIDYKQAPPGGTDSDKKEFLADVSSFANTAGGELILGMTEDKGVPTGVVGIGTADPDLQIARLDGIISAGLQPRLRSNIRAVRTQAGLTVLLIRIERSWIGPHRVIFGGHDKFYARNSAGKYPMDVSELRTAFNLSAGVADRVRAFRVDRIIAVSDNRTPVPMKPGPKLMLHCLPLESFVGEYHFDIMHFYRRPDQLPPMAPTGWDRRINLDGVVTFNAAHRDYTRSYTQINRNGAIEAVEGSVLVHEHEGLRLIPHRAYEQTMLDYLPICLRALRTLGCNVPIFIALTLTNVRGLQMAVPSERMGYYASHPIDRDTLALPETEVQDFNMPPATILKPLVDLVWNACGYEASRNFDQSGNWIKQ